MIDLPPAAQLSELAPQEPQSRSGTDGCRTSASAGEAIAAVATKTTAMRMALPFRADGQDACSTGLMNKPSITGVCAPDPSRGLALTPAGKSSAAFRRAPHSTV